MTTQIKHNENNQSPEQILASNDSGVGKTTKLPELYSWNGNVFNVAGCDSVELSDNLIKAKFTQWFHGEFKNVADKQPVLDAFSRDYLGTFHERAANKESGAKNPISNPKKVLTSGEYRANYIRLNASRLNIGQITRLLDTADGLTEKATKKELLELIHSFSELFETKENRENYIQILANEEAYRKRFASLTAAGFRDITRAGDTIIATVSLPDAQEAGAVLLENNYSLKSSALDMTNGTVTLKFIEIAE